MTVRGRPGVAFTSAGYSVWWPAEEQPCAIVSGRGLQSVPALAEGLEAVDLATWRQRLAALR